MPHTQPYRTAAQQQQQQKICQFFANRVGILNKLIAVVAYYFFLSRRFLRIALRFCPNAQTKKQIHCFKCVRAGPTLCSVCSALQPSFNACKQHYHGVYIVCVCFFQCNLANDVYFMRECDVCVMVFLFHSIEMLFRTAIFIGETIPFYSFALMECNGKYLVFCLVFGSKSLVSIFIVQTPQTALTFDSFFYSNSLKRIKSTNALQPIIIQFNIYFEHIYIPFIIVSGCDFPVAFFRSVFKQNNCVSHSVRTLTLSLSICFFLFYFLLFFMCILLCIQQEYPSHIRA